MNKYTREDKFRITGEYLASEASSLIDQELQELIDNKGSEINGHLDAGNVNMTFFHEGIERGLKIAKNKAREIHQENDKFFQRLYAKAMNDLNGNNRSR